MKMIHCDISIMVAKIPNTYSTKFWWGWEAAGELLPFVAVENPKLHDYFLKTIWHFL